MRITAQEPTTPARTVEDLERALRDALVRQFQQRNPLGELIGETPELIDVMPDATEVVYRLGEKFWKAGYIENHDKTVTIGVGQPAVKTWTLLSAVQWRELARAVVEQCRPWKEDGERDATILDTAKGWVVVAFNGHHFEFPYEFQKNGQVMLGGHQETDPRVAVFAVGIQRAAREAGEDLDYRSCRTAAKRVLATAEAEKPKELPEILRKLYLRHI